MTTLAVRRAQPPLWLAVLAGVSVWLAAWLVHMPLAALLTHDVLGMGGSSSARPSSSSSATRPRSSCS